MAVAATETTEAGQAGSRVGAALVVAFVGAELAWVAGLGYLLLRLTG